MQAANKHLLHDLTECEKLAEDERDALQQTLHATRTEKERVRHRTAPQFGPWRYSRELRHVKIVARLICWTNGKWLIDVDNRLNFVCGVSTRW